MKRYYIFFAALILFVVTVVAWQSAGSSGYKSDQTKQADLSSLSGDIEQYASKNEMLPEKLSQVALTTKLTGKIADYEYHATDYNQYQLCATFAHERKRPGGQSVLYNSSYVDVTYHGAGHQCFTYTAYGVPEVTAPKPFGMGTGNLTCADGPRDQHQVFTQGTWVGNDDKAKTVTVKYGRESTTFRLCKAPSVVDVSGNTISMSSLTTSTKVTVTTVSPGIVDPKNGTVRFAEPYVVKIQVAASSAK